MQIIEIDYFFRGGKGSLLRFILHVEIFFGGGGSRVSGNNLICGGGGGGSITPSRSVNVLILYTQYKFGSYMESNYM